MPTIDVPGATLAFDTAGKGPVLLLIPGASGTAQIFQRVVPSLSTTYTVVTYDRRGFTRSKLTSTQDYSQRLARDADDAAAILGHVSPNESAYVYGNSSGAIVALELVKRHTPLICAAVIHEPPLTQLLPDGKGEKLDAFNESVYNTYQTQGVPAAMKLFMQFLPPGPETEFMKEGRDLEKHPERKDDAVYWLEHELTKYTATPIDGLEVARTKEKLIPAFGSHSVGAPLHAITSALARRLGKDAVQLPGGHIGFIPYPVEFAEALKRNLQVE